MRDINKFKFKKRQYCNVKAFTLVEVLVATAILAFSTFAVLSLLRLSDVMAYHAKAQGAAAQIFRARVAWLSGMPCTELAGICNSTPSALSNGSYVFTQGASPSGAIINNIWPWSVGGGSPYAEVYDVFASSATTTDPTSPRYLLQGKPDFSGTPTYVYPYNETITITILSGNIYDVVYSFNWLDQVSESNPLRTLSFTFQKYDPLYL